MADVIGFVSEKGGVGKTTTVYHVAVSLARDHGADVLVLDTDYQRGGVTCRLIPEMIEDFRGGEVLDTTLYIAYRSLYAEASPPLPRLTVRDTAVGVDLVPADPRLSSVSIDKMPASPNLRDNTRQSLRHMMLIDEVLSPMMDEYDYVLIDSHPDLYDLEKAVIAASRFVVSPVKLDQQSAIGVPSTVQAINDVNKDIETAAALVSFAQEYDSTTFLGAVGMMCREYGSGLKKSESIIHRRLQGTSAVFDSYVTEGDGLRQAAQNFQPVYDIPTPNATKQAGQFRRVTRELLERVRDE